MFCPPCPKAGQSCLRKAPSPPAEGCRGQAQGDRFPIFFATDDRPLPPRRTTFADLKFLFGDAAPEEGVRYLGLGLRGSGLQGGSLEYLLDAKNLRLAVSLPWDRGYGDPEEERASVENAFQLVNLCLTFRPEEELLTLFLDADTLFWSFTKKGEILKAGGSVDGLLEALQTSDEDVDPRYWLPV